MKKNRVVLLIVLVIFIFMLSISAIIESNTFELNKSNPSVFYFPIVSNSINNLHVGVEKDFEDHTVDEYYVGDFLAYSVHAELFLNSGFAYVDAKDIPGTKVLLKLKGAYPAWIDPSCKPIPVAHWQDWVDDFAVIIIEHIGANRILYIEIMNEPDVADASLGLYFGCWGDTYADGVYYAQFVNYVTGELKALYPHIKILGGAFLDARDDFASGALATFGGIDAVSFHYYNWCGVVNFLRIFTDELESQTDLPLALTETSTIYDNPSLFCDQDQAKYYKDVSEFVDDDTLLFFVWYTLGCRSHQWRNSDMIACDPLYFKPVYQVYFER